MGGCVGDVFTHGHEAFQQSTGWGREGLGLEKQKGVADCFQMFLCVQFVRFFAFGRDAFTFGEPNFCDIRHVFDDGLKKPCSKFVFAAQIHGARRRVCVQAVVTNMTILFMVNFGKLLG